MMCTWFENGDEFGEWRYENAPVGCGV